MEVKPKLPNHKESTGNFVPDIDETFVSVPKFETPNHIQFACVVLIKHSKPTMFVTQQDPVQQFFS